MCLGLCRREEFAHGKPQWIFEPRNPSQHKIRNGKMNSVYNSSEYYTHGDYTTLHLIRITHRQEFVRHHGRHDEAQAKPFSLEICLIKTEEPCIR
jgi:hypothetical protein